MAEPQQARMLLLMPSLQTPSAPTPTPGLRHYDLDAYNRVIRANPGELDVAIADSAISGQIPPDLWGGTLYGNGPGWLEIGGQLIHPFDGHGYIRALRLQRGQLRLQARFVRTAAFVAEEAAQTVRYRGLGTMVPGGALRNIWAPTFRNVANTCVLPWAGKLYALWEGGPPYTLDPQTLSTTGIETWGGALQEKTPFLAHTRFDAAQNRLVGMTPYMGGKRTRFTFHELDQSGTVVAHTDSEIDGMGLYHDFAITPDYYVVLENRVLPNLRAFLRYKLGQQAIFPVLQPCNDRPGRALLVPRRKGVQHGVPIELGGPTYAYHHANAWQEGDRVILVSCVCTNMSFGNEFGYAGPKAPLDPGVCTTDCGLQLVRFEFSPTTAQATRRAIGNYAVDFPRVHPLRDGLATRFVYAATNAIPGIADPFDSLIGVDLETGATSVYTPQPAVFVGEPLVVPHLEAGQAATGAKDDPVWVLVTLYDGKADRSTIAIFDGQDIAGGPVATITLPVLLPYGFHGYWQPRTP